MKTIQNIELTRGNGETSDGLFYHVPSCSLRGGLPVWQHLRDIRVPQYLGWKIVAGNVDPRKNRRAIRYVDPIKIQQNVNEACSTPL